MVKPTSSVLKRLTGTMPFTLKNDYLFRVIMQESEEIRIAFISAMLDIPENEIFSANVTNPIKLGESIDSKNFIIDIDILLNDNAQISTELQIINEHNWPERSLSYLCRSFDNLNKGSSYESILPAKLICILNFTLFEANPTFFSKYYLSDAETSYIYTDKFSIFVLDLTKVASAKETDTLKIFWAKLFNAKTWEDLKMLAKDNELSNLIAENIDKHISENVIRQQCQAREEYYSLQRYKTNELKRLQDENRHQAARIAELEALLAAKTN